MNLSKSIDISKSSIVGLKAELLKKQEEVRRLKELQQTNVKPEIIQKKKSVQQKQNEGIEKRQAKDNEVCEVDYDALQKSREVLEAKSRLYEKLKGNTVDEETKSKYLIDFDLKREIDKEISLNNVVDEEKIKDSENEDDYSDSNSDPENDWVDFVDALGRSRRCLKKDLPEMRAKDAKLAANLRPPSPPPDTTPAPAPTPELLSWDMQREMMRKKWEEQETQLLGKKDIHYQDVRFDEARPHGVGYFEFSTDESERARQQEELQKLRAQTEQQQEAAQGLRARREQQLQARLAAARRRRRERLGLPPESPPHESESTSTNEKEDVKKDVEAESIIDLEESVKKIALIRPWDIGKNGVAPVMSQEEWIEKKRQERPEEFAPPSSLLETNNPLDADSKWKSNPNIFTSKRAKQQPLLQEERKKKRKKKKGKKREGKVTMDEEGEEECVGPSVNDWQAISQQDCTASIRISNSFFQECSNSMNNINPVAESRHEDFSGPSENSWKPTISDIDLLLSKSRAASFSTSAEVKNRLSPDQTMSVGAPVSNTVPSSCENTLELKFTSSSNTNSNVKRRNYNTPSTVDNVQRTNHHQRRNESVEETKNCETVIKPIVNLLEVDSDEEVERSEKSAEFLSGRWKSSKRKFAEVPPPPSMSYYIDDNKKPQNLSTKTQLADSISAGISYLKSQTEEKNKKRLKGMLDII